MMVETGKYMVSAWMLWEHIMLCLSFYQVNVAFLRLH